MEWAFALILFIECDYGHGWLSTDLTVRVLGESLGKRVLIKLKGGRVLRGLLKGYDQHMNLLLEESEEVKENGVTDPLGVIILRGDNVVLISPPPVEGGTL